MKMIKLDSVIKLDSPSSTLMLFGCSWSGSSLSGSGCSFWYYDPSNLDRDVSARGACNHYRISK